MLGEWSVYYGILFIGNLVIILLTIISISIKDKYLNISSVLLSATMVASLLCMREEYNAIDAFKYISLFKKQTVVAFFDNQIYDWGYIIFNFLLKLLTDNYSFFLFTITFLHIFNIFILYKKLSSNYYTLLLAMYLSTFVFWLSNLSMLRQGLAIPIFALAISYLTLYSKKNFFLLFSILAASIHYSAIFTAIFSFHIHFILRKLPLSLKKILGFIFLLLIIYPKNIFIDVIFNMLSLISTYIYSSLTINKIIWYFNWDKLHIWHVKHVYFLIVLLYVVLLLKEKDDKVISLSLIPLSFLALLKYDEMVTDRIFYYFVPLIPYFIYRVYNPYLRNPKARMPILILLILGTLGWFNIKLLYLQYVGWFIYPYPNVR